MGIESRDHFRDASNRAGGISGAASLWPPVCKWLLIANIAVFVVQIFVTRKVTYEDIEALYANQPADFALEPDEIAQILLYAPRISVIQEAFELRTDSVLHGQIWRVVTSAFCHDRNSVFHILFNMLFLIWFGRVLERMYSSREFLAFYLTAAVVASVTYMLLEFATGDRIPAIGASGAIMAVVMLYAMHFPREEIHIWFFIPVQIRFIVLLYVIFDLHPVLLSLAGDRSSDGVAHAAHLGGLAFGYLYYATGMRVGGLLGKGKGAKRPRPAKPNRLPKPRGRSPKNPEALESEIDEILQKISDNGFGSLTDEEKKLLDLASDHYRKRKGD